MGESSHPSEAGGAVTATAAALPSLETSPSSSSAAAAGAGAGDDPAQKEGKKKKNRCLSCKKKVGLTGKLNFLDTFLKLLDPRIILG